METVPGYVSIVFILTTFASVAFLLQAVKDAGLTRPPSRLLLFLLPLWMCFQGVLAVYGFYLVLDPMPPRLLVFGVAPPLLITGLYFLYFRSGFLERLPLPILTLLHTIRIPVELVLYWLFVAGQVPQVMTFEGRNFDILSGVLAPVVYLATFRWGKMRRGLLIAYNLLGLALLINIVATAVAALPTPLQQIAFDQPNRAVLLFPYIWLPTIVVPIVLFAHLTALWRLFRDVHRAAPSI